MMEEESKELRVMRYMAWARAKGELDAVLHSYWGAEEYNYLRMQELVSSFIDSVESEGLQE